MVRTMMIILGIMFASKTPSSMVEQMNRGRVKRSSGMMEVIPRKKASDEVFEWIAAQVYF